MEQSAAAHKDRQRADADLGKQSSPAGACYPSRSVSSIHFIGHRPEIQYQNQRIDAVRQQSPDYVAWSAGGVVRTENALARRLQKCHPGNDRGAESQNGGISRDSYDASSRRPQQHERDAHNAGQKHLYRDKAQYQRRLWRETPSKLRASANISGGITSVAGSAIDSAGVGMPAMARIARATNDAASPAAMPARNPWVRLGRVHSSPLTPDVCDQLPDYMY